MHRTAQNYPKKAPNLRGVGHLRNGEGNGLYVLKHSAVSHHLNVLATPVQIVSDISGVTVAVLISYYTKSTEAQRRAALKNLGWHVSGTRKDREISPTLQTLDNQPSESYPA